MLSGLRLSSKNNNKLSIRVITGDFAPFRGFPLNDFIYTLPLPATENIFKYIYPIYLTPLLGQDVTQGQFFKRSLTGLNSEFSFS